jgi:hypothetical protein
MLNDPSQAGSIAFAPIDDAAASALGFTPEEAESYRQDLEKINLVTATVTQDAMNYQQQNHPTEKEMADFIQSAWSSEEGALSGDDLGAMKKISAAFNQTVAQAMLR